MPSNTDAGGTGVASQDAAEPQAPGPAPRPESAPVPVPLAPRGCDRPLSEAYDVALLDLDGVVYTGSTAVPGAPEALREAAALGMRHAFVTNNASRTPAAIAAHLTRLGVPATAADVVTSGQAAARLLARRLPPGARVLVVGGNGLRIALRERGLRPVSAFAERPAAVVQGFSPDLSYALLAEGALAVAGGALFVAANADLTLPTARGAEMGNGSLVQAIAAATGHSPVLAGKPEPPPAGRCVTGPCAARLAGLAGLLTPHPRVTSADGAQQCGGWAARLDEDSQRLGLTGSGAPMDGLRALCAATWMSGKVSAAMAAPALAELGFAD